MGKDRGGEEDRGRTDWTKNAKASRVKCHRQSVFAWAERSPHLPRRGRWENIKKGGKRGIGIFRRDDIRLYGIAFSPRANSVQRKQRQRLLTDFTFSPRRIFAVAMPQQTRLGSKTRYFSKPNFDILPTLRKDFPGKDYNSTNLLDKSKIRGCRDIRRGLVKERFRKRLLSTHARVPCVFYVCICVFV